MALWPKHDSKGFFLGSISDGGGPRPHLTADQDDWPEELEGYIARRKKDAQGRWARGWDLIENHKGAQGYLNGEPYTIKDYGPYPDGWSPIPPPPTSEEIVTARRNAILARLAEIDAASVRPLRAIAQGEDVQADHDKLAALNAEAAELRAELADLPEPAQEQSVEM